MQKIIYLLLAVTILQSCATPLHTSYENARTLKSGNIQLHASRSESYNPLLLSDPISSIGTGFTVGVADDLDVRIRHYHITIGDEGPLTYLSLARNYTFSEVAFKASLITDKLAFSLPYGRYRPDNESDGPSFWTMHPKLIFSERYSPYFELYGNLNLLIIDRNSRYLGTPGFMVGLTLSSNLDKWGIRPEFSFSVFTSTGLNAYANF